jgi:hypothetical protein
MAGTTTTYALDYPTSSDLVRNGATAIQTLAQDVDTLLASTYLEPTSHVSTNTNYTRTTGSTTFGAVTGAPTQTIVTGKTGIVVIILTADIANATTTGNGMALTYNLTGTGGFTGGLARAITTQNARTGASLVQIHSLSANSTYTLTLQAASLAGSSQSLVVYNHTIQSLNIG